MRLRNCAKYRPLTRTWACDECQVIELDEKE
jgi:hypothetical protein